jgi:hypothetical protein
MGETLEDYNDFSMPPIKYYFKEWKNPPTQSAGLTTTRSNLRANHVTADS